MTIASSLEVLMLTTPACRLLGIDAPIVCAPFGPWDEVDLAAAVCGAGGLGSLGTAVRPLPELREQWARLRRIQQVSSRGQADEALRAGADVIVTQGGEAGGQGGDVGTMVMVPDVVDMAGEVPVLAAGGIADGRGLAAALTLGAQGVLMGTRFLASQEMSVSQAWKTRIVESVASDTVKAQGSERILPPFNLPGSAGVPRCLRTPLVDALREHPEQVDPAETVPRVMAAILHEILPAGEIVRRTVREAEAALAAAARAIGPGP